MRVASSSIANRTLAGEPVHLATGIMRWPEPREDAASAGTPSCGSTLTRAVSCRISDANERAARLAEVQLDRVPALADRTRPHRAAPARRGRAADPVGPSAAYGAPSPSSSGGERAVRRSSSAPIGLLGAIASSGCDRFEAHPAPRRALVEHGAALGAASLRPRSRASRPWRAAYPAPPPRPMKHRLACGLAQPPGQTGRRSPATRARARRAPAPPPPSAGPARDRRAAPRRRRPPAPTSAPSTKSPVSPSTSVSRAPPESPTTIGRAHADASMNTLPQPSTSMPAEARAARHREHVAQRVVARKILLGHLAREEHRPGRRIVGERPQASPRTGRRPRSPAPRRAPARGSVGIPRISTSWPLRATSRLTHTTSGRSPIPSRSRRSAVGRSGRNACRSAPGYSIETGTRRGTAVRTVRAMNSLHITGTREADEVM